MLHFKQSYNTIGDLMKDRDLARLGDSFVNFVYSMALTQRREKPSGAKVRGTFLAESLRRAGLRKFASSRNDSHSLADAAEAFIVYGWLNNLISLDQSIEILSANENVIEGLATLLGYVRDRVRLS